MKGNLALRLAAVEPRGVALVCRTLGANLHEARVRLGWTQAELAEAADLETRSVSRIELGELVPSLRTVVRLAEALKVPIHSLFRPARPRARPRPGRPKKTTTARRGTRSVDE